MKVCYADESGTHSRALVMVGIVADTHRLNKSTVEFRDIYERIRAISPAALKELKSTKIFYGKDEWYGVSPDIRKGIFQSFSDWITTRKHAIALAAIDTEKHHAALSADVPGILAEPWLAAAMHIALQVQKAHQKERKNKGNTFVIYDENAHQNRLAELLYAPPDWTDSYYDRNRKRPPLDQVIDSAFFVKSHHAGLVQVADLFAFVYRRFAEIADYGYTEEFAGEGTLMEGYAKRLSARLLPQAARWPRHSKSAAAQWYSDLAPPSLLAL